MIVLAAVLSKQKLRGNFWDLMNSLSYGWMRRKPFRVLCRKQYPEYTCVPQHIKIAWLLCLFLPEINLHHLEKLIASIQGVRVNEKNCPARFASRALFNIEIRSDWSMCKDVWLKKMTAYVTLLRYINSVQRVKVTHLGIDSYWAGLYFRNNVRRSRAWNFSPLLSIFLLVPFTRFLSRFLPFHEYQHVA